MAHNIVLLTWNETSKAFENFQKFKTVHLQNLHAVTLLKRQELGQLKVEEQINPHQDNGIWGGSLLGAIIGILGGPLGILLGFTAGAMIGASFDIDSEKDDLAILGKITQALPQGQVGILIDLHEEDETIINDLFTPTGASIYRWDFDDVQAEIEASVEAWQETQRIANLTLKQEKRAEHKAKWEAFKAQR